MNSSSRPGRNDREKPLLNGRTLRLPKAEGAKSAPTPKPTPEISGRTEISIVGIGSSAGGLEALEQFIGNVPNDCGLAASLREAQSELEKRFSTQTLELGKARDDLQSGLKPSLEKVS